MVSLRSAYSHSKSIINQLHQLLLNFMFQPIQRPITNSNGTCSNCPNWSASTVWCSEFLNRRWKRSSQDMKPIGKYLLIHESFWCYKCDIFELPDESSVRKSEDDSRSNRNNRKSNSKDIKINATNNRRRALQLQFSLIFLNIFFPFCDNIFGRSKIKISAFNLLLIWFGRITNHIFLNARNKIKCAFSTTRKRVSKSIDTLIGWSLHRHSVGCSIRIHRGSPQQWLRL